MDGIRELLEAIRDGDLAAGHLRGVLHIAIGRKVTKPDGTVVSAGVTWRELSGWLKQLRFDKDLVKELGADPEELAPRDRSRFWYSAVALAKVDSPEAHADAEHVAEQLKPMGFLVGPPPAGTAPPRSRPATKAKPAKPSPKPKKKKS